MILKNSLKYCVFILFLLGAWAPLSATAQTGVFLAQVDAAKNDDRFRAKLGAGDIADIGRRSNGLIKSLDIELQWWTLIGQPVEIYGIKWEQGHRYNLGGGHYLSRSSLSEYPDLVSRYDDLRPTSIEVSFDVEFFANGHGTAESYTQDFKDQLGDTYYKNGTATAKKVTDNFLIGESGKMMMDLSPSSPQDWASFIDWSSSSRFNVAVSANNNEIAKKTFKLSQSIRLKSLRITNIELPDASAKAIYDEYERREKKKKDESDNIWDDKEDVVSETVGSQDANIWTETNVSQSKTAGQDNNIWSETKSSSSNLSTSNIWSEQNIETAKQEKAANKKKQIDACESKNGNWYWSEGNQACREYTPQPSTPLILRRTKKTGGY